MLVKEFKLSNSKKLSQNPPAELFSKVKTMMLIQMFSAQYFNLVWFSNLIKLLPANFKSWNSFYFAAWRTSSTNKGICFSWAQFPPCACWRGMDLTSMEIFFPNFVLLLVSAPVSLFVVHLIISSVPYNIPFFPDWRFWRRLYHFPTWRKTRYISINETIEPLDKVNYEL